MKLRSVTSPHKKGHVMNFLVTNAISRRHSRKQGIKFPFKTALVAAVAIGIWFHFSHYVASKQPSFKDILLPNSLGLHFGC